MAAREFSRSDRRSRATAGLDPRALRGVPAYLYILRNSALKDGFLHIGSSRRGGWAKALELNRDQSNLIPGSYECVCEMRAQDSGAALEALWKVLHHTRQGNGSLDFFQIDEQSAQHLMRRCIDEADRQFRENFELGVESRRYRNLSAETEVGESEAKGKTSVLGHLPSEQIIREGIFKKAWSWLS